MTFWWVMESVIQTTGNSIQCFGDQVILVANLGNQPFIIFMKIDTRNAGKQHAGCQYLDDLDFEADPPIAIAPPIRSHRSSVRREEFVISHAYYARPLVKRFEIR
ncbi:hypothetical protein OUZ56_033861 [Daphnia magna]|uniref:Uncharacterized protein n=1 Tax=Daphnia magna TaxID=35525 RepID=A0ABQ9ZYI4_9CRUS|nr:hypothetical protein OUZ56_033861 [Daphnia magna]